MSVYQCLFQVWRNEIYSRRFADPSIPKADTAQSEFMLFSINIIISIPQSKWSEDIDPQLQWFNQFVAFE